MKKTVGIFEIEISPPYPCWCTVRTDRDEIRFSHQDLADLAHAVAELRRDAVRKLPEEEV